MSSSNGGILSLAIDAILEHQRESKKPLAIILAGHNGSGKSTMWYEHLADSIQIPLINADRMMLSILPERDGDNSLPDWASKIRDNDESWMKIAQTGVQSFVAQALIQKVPFAMETVFSHWLTKDDGSIESKIDDILKLQDSDYFVLLVFVGLSNAQLSVARVSSRHANGGHDVPVTKLIERFPRTQLAIREACKVADAAILTDNSLDEENAFSISRIELEGNELFDIREDEKNFPTPPAILDWLNVVSPR